jgi:hypothetical protein
MRADGGNPCRGHRHRADEDRSSGSALREIGHRIISLITEPEPCKNLG